MIRNEVEQKTAHVYRSEGVWAIQKAATFPKERDRRRGHKAIEQRDRDEVKGCSGLLNRAGDISRLSPSRSRSVVNGAEHSSRSRISSITGPAGRESRTTTVGEHDPNRSTGSRIAGIMVERSWASGRTWSFIAAVAHAGSALFSSDYFVINATVFPGSDTIELRVARRRL